MTAATTALVFQQCTTGRVEFFNRSREWRPSCKRSRRAVSVRAASSSSSPSPSTAEPTIDELLTKLEQGSSAAAPAAAAAAAIPSTAARRTVPPKARTYAVADEELVVDKVLTGKVKAIMAYGAFIDLGARSDGLLHISKLGAGFVKSVEDVLQMGQELQVQIIEADLVNRKIKVKVYDPNPKPAASAAGAGAPPSDAPRKTAMRNTIRRTEQPKSSYQKGEALTGVVKNLTQRGCFVELPNGEEGFLPSNEIVAGGEKSPIDALVKVGQEVKVKVLRIMAGRVNLTMKEEIDLKKVNAEMNENVFATNAFELAFRQHPGIRKYLEESGQLPDQTQVEATSKKTKDKDDASVASGAEVTDEKSESEVPIAAAAEEEKSEVPIAAAAEEEKSDVSVETPTVDEEEQVETAVSSESLEVPEIEEPQTEDPAPVASSEETVVDQKQADVSDAVEVPEEQVLVEEAAEKPVVAATSVDETAVSEKEQQEEVAPVAVEPAPVVAATSVDETVVSEKEQQEEVAPVAVEPAPVVAATSVHETAVLDEKEQQAPEPAAAKDEGKPNEPVAGTQEVAGFTISAALVKELRQQSGAGMMDCKKALVETKGNFEMAVEYLRKKGLAGADKKASRIAAEGAIGSYIHDGRIGVLVEINCETDFVSRGELFTQLVEDLAMQVAACQQVEYVSTEEVPEETRTKEFEIEMQREDLQSKPEGIRAKIVEGRVAKRFGDLALLEQPFIKNDSVIIKDLVRQVSASVGEKIQVRRFTRYTLGEGLEKRSYDIASEVAAQAKAQEQRLAEAAAAAVSAEDKKDEVQGSSDDVQLTVAPALVKQLREETGSGMMDCKKALVECRGKYEEAKEYLRKKGLASAEKKSGRIAAEGLVVSYVHSSRIGVLLELNCETDFVSRNSVFKELAEDLAMQLVACPQVDFVSVDDIPDEVKEKEREIELQREDLQDKPEQIRAKIVDGRLSKLMSERALLEQAYLKDDTVRVKDLVKQATVNLGENIRVRRFIRYNLGQGIEKKSVDLAQEIAALHDST